MYLFVIDSSDFCKYVVIIGMMDAGCLVEVNWIISVSFLLFNYGKR